MFRLLFHRLRGHHLWHSNWNTSAPWLCRECDM
jgi:hypothetical protein